MANGIAAALGGAFLAVRCPLLLPFFLQRFSLKGVVSVDNVIAQHESISLFVSFQLIAFYILKPHSRPFCINIKT